MPIYEYEPTEHDCLMCPNRVAAIQGIEDEPLQYCPDCGLPVKRVISKVSFQMGRESNPDRAAAKGFTTFKKVEKGKWEKVGGEGPDYIVGSQEDIQAIEAEKSKSKVIDLDKP